MKKINEDNDDKGEEEQQAEKIKRQKENDRGKIRAIHYPSCVESCAARYESARMPCSALVFRISELKCIIHGRRESIKELLGNEIKQEKVEGD